jgi:phosphoribosylformylglycinamidine synthase
MSKPTALIITGYGLNCEAESRCAWERAGAEVKMVHLNDLFAEPGQLAAVQALMFIGGFSYGDHMTSGHVLAQRVRHRLRDELQCFVEADKLVMGVCNGFQVMIKMGLLPGLDGEYFEQRMALMQNDCGTFQDYWVELGFDAESPCVFTRGLDRIPLPIRHGEGKLFTLDKALLARLADTHAIPCRYLDPASGEATMTYPHNPNGSLDAMAGLCDPSGRIFGMMPHPEAYLFPENHPDWEMQRLRGELPADGLGLKLFQNAVAYLS